MRILIVLIFLIITYGSLFPFNFSLLEFNQEYSGLLSLSLSGFGDILANVLLFMPLGFLYSLLNPKDYLLRSHDNVMLWFKIFSFSFVLQVLQIALPGRDQNITDVIFNMIGFSIAYYAVVIIHLPSFELKARLQYLPYVIAIIYLFSELSPFVPALDFQQIKSSIKPLLSVPTFAPLGGILTNVVMWLLVIRLLSFQQIKMPFKWVLLLWWIMLFGKVIIYGSYLSYSDLLAPLLAILLAVVLKLNQPQITKVLIFLVLFIFVLSSVSNITQFDLSFDDIMPFYGYLSGRLDIGLQVILYKIFIFSSIIWLALELSLSAKRTAISLAFLVVFIEISQLFMPSRTTDFADVILVVLAYLLVRNLGDLLVEKEIEQQEIKQRESQQSNNTTQAQLIPLNAPSNIIGINFTKNQKTNLFFVALYIVFYGIMNFSLTIPGVPYNVVELFEHKASAVDLLFFLIFLLSLGGGSRYILSKVSQNEGVSIVKFIALHLLSLAIIFICLWLAVTVESIEDIVGSSKLKQALYAAQTSQNFFMVLMNILSFSLMTKAAEFIDFFLHFSALFGLVQIPLVLWFIMFDSNITMLNKLRWITISLLLIVLCYLVVFTFAVTDNLTELIANPVLLLIALIGLTLVIVISYKSLCHGKKLLPIIFTLLTAGISWLLAQYVFEQVIIKYGYVFSALDFLIGAGRESKVSEQSLFIRWFVVLFSFQWIIILGSKFLERCTEQYFPDVYVKKAWRYVTIGFMLLVLSYIGNRLFGEHMHWQTLKLYFSGHSQQSFTIDKSKAVIPDDAQPGEIYINGKFIATLGEAFYLAQANDTIHLTKGYYNEAAILTANNVRIIADVGAVIYGKSVEGKGALVIKGDNTYIEGLECHSVYVPDNNGVCIRLEGKGIYLNKVYFHHAQGGLLGSHKGGDIRVENSRFEHLGDGAFYHGIYTLEETRLFINNSSFLNNRNGGHEIKSRSYYTEIASSVIASSQSRDSRLIDVPNGGILIIRNNILIEGQFSENHDLLSWGVEGVKHEVGSINIESNTIISDKSNARLMSVKSKPDNFSIKNNIVVGNIEGIMKNDNLIFKERAELSIPEAPFIPKI